MLIKIADKVTLTCGVADTPEKQWWGLQGCLRLGEDEGMVFPFASAEFVEMTMQGMSIPIDMIFVGKDSKIIKIAKSVQPQGEAVGCARAEAAIEIQAGVCDAKGIEVGDVVACLTT